MARYPNPLAAVRASWLIARARQGTPELSQSALAEENEISQGTLSKYERGQSEPSFAELQRIIGHTDYRLEVRLRREPHRPQTLYESYVAPDFTPYAVHDTDLRERLPAQLRPLNGRLPLGEEDGPRIEETLLRLYEVRHLRGAARSVEGRLQEAYQQWHDERDRDLIHQVLAVGTGAAQAAARIAAVIDERTPVRRKGLTSRKGHEEPRFERLAWAHIVCCLRAEETICRQRASWLRRALALDAARESAQRRVENAARMASISSTRAERQEEADRDLADAEKDLAQAVQRCSDFSLHTGGQTVGRAGERFIAIELDGLAEQAGQLFAELAKEPAFTAWRSEYRAVDPLFDAWLDGPLASAFTPPPLYTDLSDLTGIIHRLPAPAPGPEPYGPAEHTVYDHLDRSWQIVTVQQEPTTNPRKQRPQVAILALTHHAPGSEADPDVAYLLADGVAPARAAETVASARRTTDLLAAATTIWTQ